MPLVTISGQIGTGARDIGRMVAERLQLDYIDQEILVEAARALGVPVESVVAFDERTATIGERLAAMLRRFLERSATAGAGDPMLGSGGLDIVLGRSYGEAVEGLPDVSEDRYVATLTGIVRDLAAHDNAVIIGRGSQVILKDWPGAFHVLLAAPRAQRLESYAQRAGLGKEEAAKRLHDSERGRAAFHQQFFKVDVDDPALYHLTLNTARFSTEQAAQLVIAAVQPATASPRP